MISLTTSLVIAATLIASVAVAVAVFHGILKRVERLSVEDRIAAWETFLKAITAITAIVAGLVAFLRYVDQRQVENEVRALEAAQKVREFNIQIYGQAKSTDEAKRVLLNEAADTAATLATLDDLDSPMGQIAMDRFERLYYGQLNMYEGPKVQFAMINFRDALVARQGVVREPGPLPAEPDEMRTKSRVLALACREELEQLKSTPTSEPTEATEEQSPSKEAPEKK